MHNCAPCSRQRRVHSEYELDFWGAGGVRHTRDVTRALQQRRGEGAETASYAPPHQRIPRAGLLPAAPLWR